MSQYQRMVSYLYRYENDVKGNNVGYARIELRGDSCRITVQMRDALSELPEAAFFRQEAQGVQRIGAARLKKNGNGFGCRIETRTDNMVDSGYSFSDLDGLMVYVNDFLYYATTWKDITVHFGQESYDTEKPEAAVREGESVDSASNDSVWNDDVSNGRESSGRESNDMSNDGISVDGISAGKKDEAVEMDVTAAERMEYSDGRPAGLSERGAAGLSGNETAADEAEQRVWPGKDVPEAGQKVSVEASELSEQSEASGETETDTVAACQCEACRRCPQRGRMGDFGHHILAMFPRMYPFEIESMKECVRLELKDIGCLPVPYWSLSGNPFLLHGYYCYRHILFTRVVNGDYYIGVPGIYNQEGERQAKSCGFQEFKTLSEVADRQGAFGYWLFPVSV